MPDYKVVIETIYSTNEDVDPDELSEHITESLETVDMEFSYASDITPYESQDREEPVNVEVNCDTITLVTVTRLEE